MDTSQRLRPRSNKYESGFCNVNNHQRCTAPICSCPCHTQPDPDQTHLFEVTTNDHS